jgi:hypothetical protein
VIEKLKDAHVINVRYPPRLADIRRVCVGGPVSMVQAATWLQGTRQALLSEAREP